MRQYTIYFDNESSEVGYHVGCKTALFENFDECYEKAKKYAESKGVKVDSINCQGKVEIL